MTVENLNGPLGLARLDAAQRGEPLQPIPVAQVIREAIPAAPTNRERRNWRKGWPGLQASAKQELGQ